MVRKAFLVSATSLRQKRYGLHLPALSRQTEDMRIHSDTVDASSLYTRVTFLILNCLSDRVPVNNQTLREFTSKDCGLFLLASLPDLVFSLGVQRTTLPGQVDSRNRIQKPCCDFAWGRGALWSQQSYRVGVTQSILALFPFPASPSCYSLCR